MLDWITQVRKQTKKIYILKALSFEANSQCIPRYETDNLKKVVALRSKFASLNHVLNKLELISSDPRNSYD